MGDNSQTTKSSGTQNTTFQPDPTLMKEWQDLTGTMGGLTDYFVNNPPPEASVAGPTDLTKQWWNQAGQMAGGPDLSTQQQGWAAIMGNVQNQQVDPSQINFNSNFNFTPGGIDFNNPWAAGVPTAQAPGGVSGNYQDYLAPVQNVSAERIGAQNVNAPGAIRDISGLLQVAAPQLQKYQFDPSMMQQVAAPNLKDFQMQAAANVAPSGLATTGSWNDPGTAAAFMSPYAQQVVDVQKQKATEDWNQALETQRSQAAAAGAYGGSRQAVEEATGQRDLQLQLAQIQASGLQNAYQQGQQQFNTQQQQALAAQQFNIQSSLQAALSNQQMQQQANVQNLSSFLQTQGLGAQTGLQAGLANQQAGLTVGGQNLQALLATQQLGAGNQMQAQLANQQTGLQQAIANQQGQEFSAGQQLQASLANQQANLAAAQANQQTGLQAGLANQASNLQAQEMARQMGLQGAQFTSAQQAQMNLANQAAKMQAMAQQYAGGLQGALQTQQLGMQGQIAGGQLGLQAQTAQQAARQAAIQGNLAGAGLNAGILGQSAQGMLNQYGMGLQGMMALAQAAQGQQGMAQQNADVAYQNALQRMMTPMQAEMAMAQMLGMQPIPYTQNTASTGQVTQPGPSWWSQLIGGLAALGGTAAKFATAGAGNTGGAVASGGGGSNDYFMGAKGGLARMKEARGDDDDSDEDSPWNVAPVDPYDGILTGLRRASETRGAPTQNDALRALANLPRGSSSASPSGLLSLLSKISPSDGYADSSSVLSGANQPGESDYGGIGGPISQQKAR